MFGDRYLTFLCYFCSITSELAFLDQKDLASAIVSLAYKVMKRELKLMGEINGKLIESEMNFLTRFRQYFGDKYFSESSSRYREMQ